MPLAFIIALGAGIASAALFASAWTGTALGVFFLFFLSPLPVVIAGLGWGWAAGAIAVAAAMAIVAVTGGGRSGLVYLVAFGGPAAVFTYLAMLNRFVPTRPEVAADGAGSGPVAQSPGTVEWYPVGRIVSWACLWAGVVAVLALLGIGLDVASIRAALLDVFEKSLFAEGMGPAGRKLTSEEKNAFVAVMTMFFPWAIATVWYAVAMLNLWVGGHLTHLSGQLTRPWPDLSALQLPPWMALAFGLSILATFTSGMPGLLASGFASALMFAFMLVGLAILHRVTRGNPIRGMLLGLVYGALIFLSPFSSLLISMIGLAEPYLRGRLPSGGPPPASSST